MRIVLADLRHTTVGRHSAYMPIAIGYIASFASSHIGQNNINISIHTDALETAETIAHEKPDIVGFSNYIWNAELSGAVGRFAKEVCPSTIVVGGGPEFPRKDDEIIAYLKYRREIDFFVNNYEGELPFTELIKAVCNTRSVHEIKKDPPPGIITCDNFSILRRGAPPPRLKELDTIPSPILSGMMDKYLIGNFMPFLETTRGCPYSCAYCVQGVEWFNKIATFSMARIADELRYIAARICSFHDIPLAFADSNFGMFSRDEDIAEIINELQEVYGWPRSFIVDTGKSQLERLVRVAKKLNRRISMSVSPQSLNPATLTAIKRKNLGGNDLTTVYKEFQKHNITTNAAIIVPLPEETKGSYIDGLRKLSESNVEQPLIYTTMLLKGTLLADKQSREQYAMKTKYRILPRQFGEYFGKRVFEFDEVCIETSTMSFDEYVDCRSVAFTFLALSNKQFDIFKIHCFEYNIHWFEFLLAFWEQARKDTGRVGRILEQYEAETKGELFDSQDDIRRFVDDNENYSRLIDGEMGDNLIRKLSPRLILNEFVASCNLGYEVLADMFVDRQQELNATQEWCLAVRDVTSLLQGELELPRQLNVEYDFETWYNQKGIIPLASLKKNITYSLSPDIEGIRKAVKSMQRLYGPKMRQWASRLLEAKPIDELWYHCKTLQKD